MNLGTIEPNCTSDFTYKRGKRRRMYRNWRERIVIFSTTLNQIFPYVKIEIDFSEYNGSFLRVHMLDIITTALKKKLAVNFLKP